MNIENAVFDAVFIGSCITDIFCYVPKYPGAGQTVRASRTLESLGGKCANQAAQCGLLGAKVALLAKIGNDLFGQKTLKSLIECGVNCDYISTSATYATGFAFITTVESTGESHQVWSGGASGDFLIEDLLKAESIIRRSKYLVAQLGVPRIITLESMKLAKKHGIKVIFNAAPVVEDFNLEFLKLTNILCVNEDEAKSLIKHHETELDDQMQSTVDFLFENYPNLELIIVTLGGRGCCFSEKENTLLRTVRCTQVHVVDTTGAGDSFLGAFVYYLTNFQPMKNVEEILKRCNKIAAQSVQKHGSAASYTSKKDLPVDLFS